MRIGSLFSGVGGADLAVQSIWPHAHPAWFVEFDKHPSAVLAAHWPDVPNYGDVTTVDWSAVEPVDILTGGFPCQDLSHAGKRAGLRPGTRSGLWEHMASAIDQLRPPLVVIENVRGLLSAEAHSDLERDCWCVGDEREPALRALGAVLGDLAGIGYDARWTSVRAADAGAPHGRFRVFVLAHPAGDGRGQGRAESDERSRGAGLPAGSGAAAVGDTDGVGRERAGASGVEGRRGRPADTDQHAGVDALLPTPTRSHWKGRNQRDDATCLPGALLPTPNTSDANDMGAGIDLLPTVRAVQGENRNSTIYVRDAPQQNLENALAFTLTEERGQLTVDSCGCQQWGPYAPALHRWEQTLGRLAPEPTELSRTGRRVLSPLAVEFMMGLPEGWVTDTGIPRNAQLKALGNGIVPQQMALALRLLMDMP